MLTRGGEGGGGDARHNAPGRAAKTAAPDAFGATLGGLALALQFLTVLPVQAPRRATRASERDGEQGDEQGDERDQAEQAGQADQAPNMASALPWFPLVGALIGVALALLDWALRPALSVGVRSALVLIVAAALTGMLHLDGFIDCCDGLLGTRSTERRLVILRDSRVGAYGVVGGCLLILLRFAALVALAPPDMRALALIAAPLLGRWSMVYAVVRYPYARSSGVGAPFRATGRSLVWATILAGALLALTCLLLGATVGGLGVLQAQALAAMLAAVALAVMLIATAWMSGRLDGGLTGDTYGALNECVEAATLVLLPLLVVAVTHLPRG